MRANDRAWIVVVRFFIFTVINFADKAVIGIVAVPIMQELELGPRQFPVNDLCSPRTLAEAETQSGQ